MPYPAPSDPEHIHITAVTIDALTKAWGTVTMPAEMALIMMEASNAKLTLVQVVMLSHFMFLPSCSPDVSLQMASQPDVAP